MEAQHESSTELISAKSLTRSPETLLQRKCACGGSSGMTDECEECQQERLTVQRYSRSRRTLAGLPPSLAQPFTSNFSDKSRSNGRGDKARVAHAKTAVKLQTKSVLSQPTDHLEQEADRAAEQVTAGSISAGGQQGGATAGAAENQNTEGSVASAESPGNDGAEETAPGGRVPATPESAGSENGAGGFIADDGAHEVGPTQMRKGDFLDQLRVRVCAVADAELAAVGQSSAGCPYVERWIGYYRTRTSRQTEQALRRYAPEAAAVSNARDYIPIVAERVRRAVAVWATTGEVTGVPDEMAGEIAGARMLRAAAGVVSGTGRIISSVIGGIGSVPRRLLAKAKAGGAQEADNPKQIQSQLGAGLSLDNGVRTRMESAFGHDFSRVRVHTDATAAQLSSNLNARAFTVGSDIAFGAGEYQPGMPIGEALIAHELAHVVQQGGSDSSMAPMRVGGAAYDALEDDADSAAVGAVVSAWGGVKGKLRDIAAQAGPRLRSGLRLSRCPSKSQSCPTQTVTMSGAQCGAQYGAVGTYCYSGANGWWFKENVVNGSPNTCDTSPISQTGTPFQAVGNCVNDRIFDMNGPPGPRAPCTDVTNQTVFTGPTQATVEQCQYHNEQRIEVTLNPGAGPRSGRVITSSAGVSSSCNWP